jgi:hypothetical protein
MKMLMWRDILLIIEEMFEIKPEDVAGLLGIDASIVSRLRKGQIKKSSHFKPENVYEKIFHPSVTPLNLDEKDSLFTLQQLLVDKGFLYVIDDIIVTNENYDKGDYEKFVLRILRRVNKIDFEKRFLAKIRGDLRKVMLEYEIPSFIEADPISLMHASMFYKADDFTTTLDTSIKASYFKYKNMTIYRQIYELEQLIGDYIDFLALNMKPTRLSDKQVALLKATGHFSVRDDLEPCDVLVPMHRDDAREVAIHERATEYRRLICKLTDVIFGLENQPPAV